MNGEERCNVDLDATDVWMDVTICVCKRIGEPDMVRDGDDTCSSYGGVGHTSQGLLFREEAVLHHDTSRLLSLTWRIPKKNYN